MKVLIMLFLLSPFIYSINCDKHPIYCQMKKLLPNRNASDTMALSNLFHKYARKYGQDPLLSVAIARQETGLREINRRQNIIKFFDKCDKTGCYEDYEIVRGYTDICLFQFHVDTIVHEKLNPVRLKNDIDYCVEQHFKLLKKKRRLCKHLGEDSWTCYHSKSKKLREFYKSLVMEYYDDDTE